MNYIDLNDVYLLIQPTQVTQLIGNSGSTNMDLAVDIALAEVKSYLIQKYDINAEYALTGNSRSLQIRMAVVDVALFILHSRIAPSNVPELRKLRYEQTISWLKGVARGSVTPELQEIDITTTGSRIRSGFDDKNPNKY